MKGDNNVKGVYCFLISNVFVYLYKSMNTDYLMITEKVNNYKLS